MNLDSRLSSVLHALLHMAAHDGAMTSDELAACMGTNPVVVRRSMGHLRDAGIVGSERGPAGGWRITGDLSAITLLQLHDALGETAVFAFGPRNRNPQCLVERAVNTALADAMDAAEALLRDRLGRVTLAQLAADFTAAHDSRRQHKD